MQKYQDDNNQLAFWLSNTVTLLHSLQRNLRPAGGVRGSRKREAAAVASPGSSFMAGLSSKHPHPGDLMPAVLTA